MTLNVIGFRWAALLLLVWIAPAAFAADAVAPNGDQAAAASKAPRVFDGADAPKPKPVAQPAPEAIVKAIRRGVEFLITRQNKDGSWGSAHRTKGLDIYAPAPGAHLAFRSGTTALCVQALLEAGGTEAEAVAALDRGEEWLLDNLPKLRRAAPDAIYNNWGHAYGLQCLAAMLKRKPHDTARNERIRKEMAEQIDRLRRYECVDGGWAYYDFVAQTQQPSGSTISFVSATALIALHKAKEAGVEAPEKMVHRAIDSIIRQRKPDFSYCYGEYLKLRPMHPVNRPGGSLGRSQACNLALRLWGDKTVTDAVMETWLDRLFARNLWLDIGRKRPIPHESWFMVAGYFFYYGHYYAALCIEQLPAAERPERQDHLAQILLKLQESDGCWWDFPLYDYHQAYGTAFAIMSLQRCRR